MIYPSLGLLSFLLVNTVHGAPVNSNDNDGPPDFSSHQYPGQPAERAFKPSYDFCVVGGGAAGLVLGNRLSESGKHAVIVFEAGPAPTEMLSYAAPGGSQPLSSLNGAYSPIDYNFYTVPQEHLFNRSLNYHRGRCLGGSSVTNGMFYGLGSTTIYDQWESDGNPGWGWKEIQASAKRGTKFVGNPDHTNDNTYMTWDPDAYGTEGPLKIGFQGRVVTSCPSFMNATSAIGIQPVLDQNNGSPLGIKQGTITIDENFYRSSSYDSYYMASKGRPNLNMLDRAIVGRIIFDESSTSYGGDDAAMQAVGVTFLDEPSGILHNVSCKNEVILAAGAFHSPFILKQSGIGPKDELEKYGISPIVVNENVGENMQDHTSFSVIHEIKPEFAAIASMQDMNDVNVLNQAQREFYAGGSSQWNSKYSSSGGTTSAFQELSNEELESIGAGAVVAANLTNQAHNEYLYEPLYYPAAFTKYGGPEPNKSYVSITISNMVALSKGSVKIAGNFPFTDPLIDPNYLAEEADQRMAIQGVKYARKIFAHPDLQRLSAGEASPGADITSDEDILDYARSTIIPNWHASSTCRMLPRDKGGVIDSHMRVYGTKSLRVCDVSTFSRLPDINLIGSVYGAAENGARIVREDYGDV